MASDFGFGRIGDMLGSFLANRELSDRNSALTAFDLLGKSQAADGAAGLNFGRDLSNRLALDRLMAETQAAGGEAANPFSPEAAAARAHDIAAARTASIAPGTRFGVYRPQPSGEEMATFTKLQILQQSGLAVLAQANSTPQSVLGLLR